MPTRRQFTASIEARVALAALREDRTVQQLGPQYGVHPYQVSLWKKRAREGLTGVFETSTPKGVKKPFATEIQALHAKIGEQVVERDFLRTAFGR